MRFARPLVLAAAALSVVACTAILGDFTVSGGTNILNTEGGTDAPIGGPVTVTPGDGKIGIFRSQAFTASEDVTWSVQEGDSAGRIDDKGVFLSGGTPGTYHVVAASKADPTRKGTAPIVVVNLAISVLAGPNGGAGNIDGTAKVAHLNGPTGVAGFYDQSLQTRRYWIADTGNHTIRYYEENKTKVTTVAGAPGLFGTTDGVGDQARFSHPRNLLVDPLAKKLYVNDSNGTCIRSLDIQTNAVQTVAGTCGSPAQVDGPPAKFLGIRSMALSGTFSASAAVPSPAIYVCDQNAMRVVELSTGKASNVAVNGYCSEIATDSFSGGSVTRNIFARQGATVVRIGEPAAITGFPVNGGTTVVNGVGNVDGMVVAGNDLFFSSSSDSVMYRTPNATYTATAIAFNTTPWLGTSGDQRTIDGNSMDVRLGKPNGLFSDNQYSEVLFADTGAHAVRRVATYNGSVDTIAGAARLMDVVDGPRATARMTGPFAVAADEAGIVYFGDINFDGNIKNSTIRKYDRTAAIMSSVSGVPTQPMDPATPPVDGPKNQARFWFPIDMTYAKGKLYVVDNFAQAVRSVDVTTGEVKTIAGELGVPGNSDGVGVAAHFKFNSYASASGGAGFLSGGITTDGTNLYLADSLNYAIRKVVIATGETSTIAGGVQGNLNGTGKAAQFVSPIAITYDNGFLYIGDYSDHTVRRMNLATAVVDQFIGLSGQAGDKDGDAATATLNSPFRIRADGLGNLYFSELPITTDGQPSGLIRRVDLRARTVTSFAGQPGKVGLQQGPIPSTLNCPTSLTIMPQHDLAFGDFCENSIGIFQPL